MKKYLLLILLVFEIHPIWAQNRSIIKGTILSDSTTLPLSGAVIHALSSNTAANSDKDGHFMIPITQDDTLSVSYVGYKIFKIAVNSDTKYLQIRLISNNDALEDVMIHTGYQTLKPNEVNGSYVVINNKMLNQQTGLNILDRLNGVTSSLLLNIGKQSGNPESNTNITIRGLSTINGPLDPLIVVDNFIYTGDISNINPNDVESVTILKDAAAASIWGARAGNGVIVITTKKGHFNQKLQIDVSSNVSISEKPDLFATPRISSSDYIEFEQMLFNNGYFNRDFINRAHPAISPAVRVFQDRRNGLISVEDSVKEIQALKKIDNRNQYLKYYSHHDIIQQHAINLRGGNRNVGWLISGTYDNSRNSDLSDYHKINLRFENSYRPFKRLTLRAGVYYTNSIYRSGLPSYETVSKINNRKYVPYMNLVGEGGFSIPVLKSLDSRYTDTAGAGYLLNWNYYPLEEYKHSYTKTNVEAMAAHIGLDYNIIKGLDLSLMYQYSKQHTDQRISNDTASYYARNLINMYSQLNRTTGTVDYIIPLGGILNQTNKVLNSYNFRGQLSYDKIFDVHHIRAMAGLEARDEWSSNDGSTYYGYFEDPLINGSNLDYSSYYPNFVSGVRLRIPFGTILSARDNRFVSIFSNASYNYKERYSFSASIRKDGSNIFGANTNDKWKPLWSLGLGWVLSKEPFYNSNWLSYMKLSATYGVSGNVDLTKTALPVGKYNQIAVGSTRIPALGIIQVNNPDLSWEKSYQTNVRVDFSLKKNIISGSFEYYRKRGTDLYAPTPYDYTTFGGSTTITANVANMKGKGVDIAIHSLNLNRKLKWTTSFLYSYNQSITTKYMVGSATTLRSFLGGSNSITPVIGKPLYGLAVYRWGGLDAYGNPQGYIHDTLSTDYQKIAQSSLDEGLESGSFDYIGPASPTSYGSVMNEFSYEGFSLSFNLVYKFGYYLMKPSLNYSSLARGDGLSGVDFDSRWQRPGDETKTNVPSFTYPLDNNRDFFYKVSSVNVIKGDHIRFQFLRLSYSVPRKKGNTLFKSLQFFFNASNLGIVWEANNHGVDPDNLYGSTASTTKTYAIGLSASF